MKKTVLLFAFVLALVVFEQTAWAQNYITDVMVIGYASQSDASDAFESFEMQGWTGINHNLNSGTDDGYYIYLMYKTDSSPYSSGTPISDLYLRVSDSNDAPDEFTLDGRTYHRSYCMGLSNFMFTTKGDLNCGAGGKYIHLYYTKDAYSPGRVVTTISIDNTSNNTAVCENGCTTPCDLNKGAGGDYIYLHVSKSMTGDVAVVYTEAELLDALTLNNANIRLGTDIYLSSSLVIEHNRTITIDLNGRYSRDLMQHLANSVCNAADTFIRQPEMKLQQVSLLDAQQTEILDIFNQTEVPYDNTQTIVSLFRRQVELTPDNMAVVYHENKYTYREVDDITERMAAYLVAKGLGKEDVVSILIPRCEWMPIGALGVLKAGCAYQPLDPSYPAERLNFMIQDASAKLLIADESLRDIVNEYQGDVLLRHQAVAGSQPACQCHRQSG